MSLSLIAVFIPILLMGGIVGRLFREFSRDSGRCHRRFAGGVADNNAIDVREVLHPDQHRGHGKLYRAIGAGVRTGFSRIGYRVSLGWVLRHQPFMLGLTVVTACLNSVYLYVIVPKGFFPQQDTGRLQGNHPGVSGHGICDCESETQSDCRHRPGRSRR